MLVRAPRSRRPPGRWRRTARHHVGGGSAPGSAPRCHWLPAASPPWTPRSPLRRGRSTSPRSSPTGPAGAECGTEAVPLLTIASSEWDGGSATWIAEEDRPAPGPPPLGARDGDFTLIDITGGNNLQLHVCPSSPHHPHFELLQ
ncbi:hypothetical protein GCM10018782_51950 [Streptomyces griseoaurantiacus]|nr:hypothetical protein GCM10018782_51950 [Streptomyces griseoaurantiacus]